jgi:hypothetical protein
MSVAIFRKMFKASHGNYIEDEATTFKTGEKHRGKKLFGFLYCMHQAMGNLELNHATPRVI